MEKRITKSVYTFTATSSPSLVLALYTWAKLAAAIGVLSNSENTSSGSFPKSSKNKVSNWKSEKKIKSKMN